MFRGSALFAATGGDPKLGKEAILALMEAVRIHVYIYIYVYTMCRVVVIVVVVVVV
jgi:hypothetical protein